MNEIPHDWRAVTQTAHYQAAQEYLAANFHESKHRLLAKMSCQTRELLWGVGPKNFVAKFDPSPLVPIEKGPEIAVTGYFRQLPNSSKMQGFEFPARKLSYTFGGSWVDHVITHMHKEQRRAMLDAAFAKQLNVVEKLMNDNDVEFETLIFLHGYIDRLEAAYQDVIRGRRKRRS